MAFSSKAQIINGGFETWNAGLPDNWWGVIMPPYNLLTQTNSAHSGNYAVKLQVESLSGQAFASPLATGNGVTTTHPLTFVPGSVSFWYELTAVNNDQLTITALVYSGGSGVGVGILQFSAAANYTYANVPIMYGVPPATADSIALIFTFTNQSGTASIGSEAKIDDVSANLGSSIQNQHDQNNALLIFPNPADKSVTVKTSEPSLSEMEICLLDATGRLVANVFKTNTSEQIIELSSLKEGNYFCIVKQGNRHKFQSLVVKHK